MENEDFRSPKPPGHRQEGSAPGSCLHLRDRRGGNRVGARPFRRPRCCLSCEWHGSRSGSPRMSEPSGLRNHTALHLRPIYASQLARYNPIADGQDSLPGRWPALPGRDSTRRICTDNGSPELTPISRHPCSLPRLPRGAFAPAPREEMAMFRELGPLVKARGSAGFDPRDGCEGATSRVPRMGATYRIVELLGCHTSH